MTWAPVGGAVLAGALVVALARLAPGSEPVRATEGSIAAHRPPLGGDDGPRRPVRAAHFPLGSRQGSPYPAGAVAVWLLVLGVLAVVVLGVVPAVATGFAGMAARAGHIRASRRRSTQLVDQAMPELIDLLVIAAAAGHTVHGCLDVVADRAPESVREALMSVRTLVARGAPLAEGLQRFGPELGALGPSLTEALVAGQRTGSPLAPALRQVAATARDRRRRAAEEAARRLPVTLLFPLVCCVLPAFGLLAVVPLLAGSLGSLRT